MGHGRQYFLRVHNCAEEKNCDYLQIHHVHSVQFVCYKLFNSRDNKNHRNKLSKKLNTYL